MTPAARRVEATATKQRAVIYLRVSTRDQAKRGGEAEGFSIPAQREACLRKAEALGAEVIGEYVDAGESARSANRPNLKRMLASIQREPIDYVIVHKVDRLARNRADDVEITLTISSAGGQLVSCTENIDETPSGMLLHGIMSSIAEFYSRNLATEAKKGMRQKAKRGGTPGIAPFGYINTSERTPEGREVRTVVVDPERAQWVPWIYERYATGEWTFSMLRDALADKGVRSLPRPQRPAAALAVSHIATILKNRYYVGVVTFEGVEYRGRHEPLITEELFDICQRVRTGRHQSREKPSLRTHYLKGTVRCGSCGEPLSIQTSRGRLGTYYDYFYCTGRQLRKNGCQFRATAQDRIEELVRDHWATIQLSENAVAETRRIVWDHFDTVIPARDTERLAVENRLANLKREADKLLQAYYADAIAIEQLRDEQARIAGLRAGLERRLNQASLARESLEASAASCCELLSRAHDQYLACDPNGRRDLNQSVFRAIYIEDEEVVGVDFTPAIDKLLDTNLPETLAEEAIQATAIVRTFDLFLIQETATPEPLNVHDSGVLRSPQFRVVASGEGRTDVRRRPRGQLPWETRRTPDQEVQGSNVSLVVGVTGFELFTRRFVWSASICTVGI